MLLVTRQSTDQQFSLMGEKLKIVGKVVMRIGNVGSVGSDQPSIESIKSKPTFNSSIRTGLPAMALFTDSDALRLLPTSRIVSSTPPFDVVQQRPGEITASGVKDYRLTRAHRIVDSYPNISSVLHSSVIVPVLSIESRAIPRSSLQDPQAHESERQRKLARMEAVRKRVADTATDDTTVSLPQTNRKLRELRENDLRTISMYRHQTKHEDIAHHLMSFITREVHVRLMPGHVEFFEYVLQNPYSEQHSISIACDDDELR